MGCGVRTPVESWIGSTDLVVVMELDVVVEDLAVAGLVLGLPINMDGSEGPRAQSTRAFVRNLAHTGCS